MDLKTTIAVFFPVLLFVALGIVRYRLKIFERPPDERQWPGQGIDTTRMSRRVWRIKQDYSARAPVRPPRQRKTLLGAARRLVAGRAYFRHDHAADSTTVNPTSQI